MKRCGSSPSIASPVTGSVLSSSARSSAAGRIRPAPRASCRIASAKNSSLLGSARNLARVSSSRLRKVSAAAAGLSRSGSANIDVESDHDGAEPGQIGDQIGDPRPRPGPLAEFGQALVVDIDDGDRPCGLVRGDRALEGVEGPDPEFLDRGGIGDAQARRTRSAAQGTSAAHSRAPLQPPSQYPQSFHAAWVSRLDGSGMLDSRERLLYRLPRIRYYRCRPGEE